MPKTIYKIDLQKCLLCILLSFCIFCFNTISYANVIQLPMSKQFSGEWHLSAEKLSTINNGAILEAAGDVVLKRGKDSLKADFVRYYTATEWVFVKGNVELKTEQNTLTASEAEIDLKNFTGFLHDGEVLMEGQHVYVSGEYVEKFHGNVYNFDNATLTTCDPNDPLWQINAGNALIDIDGIAKLTAVEAQLGFASTPSIPFMSISLVETRRTGFLPPSISNSTALGFSYTQPFFWAIDEGQDLTVSGTAYSKQSVRGSVKYRTYADLNTKAWLAGDYVIATDGARDDRYWLRGMGEGAIFDSEWRYRVNLDFVSDDEYLLDFRTSYLGHERTTEEVYDFFGREFAPIQDDRVSVGYIFRTWKDLLFTAGFELSQNPEYGSTLARSTDPTVQILPKVATYLYPISVFDAVPVQLDASLAFAHNYRRSGTSGFSSRIDPRLSTPIDFDYFTILPQFRAIHRGYITEANTNSAAPLEPATTKNTKVSDFTFDVKVQSMMQASRVWDYKENSLDLIPENIGKSETIALQHRIEPKLTYLFAPNQEQEHLPFYSQDDRILSQNEIQFSLTNIFTAKKEHINQSENEEEEILLSKSTYYDTFARFTVGAVFDIEESKRTILVDKYRKKPFRDLTLDTTFSLLGMGLTSHLSVSLYGEGITKFDLSTKVPLFSLEKYLTWHTEVSYRNTQEDYYNIVRYDAAESVLLNEKVTLLKNTTVIKPVDFLALTFEHYVNLEDRETYTITSGIDFYHDCLHFGFDYIYSIKDQSVNFRFSIPGFFE